MVNNIQSAQALKTMKGDTISFNIADKEQNTVSPLIRITWEYSPSISEDMRDSVDHMMSEIADSISDMI